MSRMTQKERRTMMSDAGKEHGFTIEFYGSDGKSWFSSDAPITKEQRDSLIAEWRRVFFEMGDTGEKVEHFDEVETAIFCLRKGFSAAGDKQTLDFYMNIAANILARTEAKRVESIQLLKAVTTIAMNYAKPGDPAFAGHPHELCEGWIVDAIKCLNANGETL